jgi:hypothetical protein
VLEREAHRSEAIYRRALSGNGGVFTLAWDRSRGALLRRIGRS